MADLNYHSLVFQGLGLAASFIAADQADYFVKADITLPTIPTAGMVSQVITTIAQNGTPVYVSAAGISGFKELVSCLPGDLITVTLSSSLPSDQALNVVKSTISFGEGL
jgi:hypothetical protein